MFAQTDTAFTPRYGKFGWGMELGPVSGLYFLTGDAKQQLTQGWAYSSLGMTFSYARVHFMLQAGGASGKIREKLNYGSEWKKNNLFYTSNVQLSVGYEVLNTKHFSIIPFTTGGVTGFNTRADSTGADGYGVSAMTYAFGTAFDYKLNWQCLYFRVITGIYPTYFQRPLGMRGALGYANLSVGFYITNRKEVVDRDIPR